MCASVVKAESLQKQVYSPAELAFQEEQVGPGYRATIPGEPGWLRALRLLRSAVQTVVPFRLEDPGQQKALHPPWLLVLVLQNQAPGWLSVLPRQPEDALIARAGSLRAKLEKKRSWKRLQFTEIAGQKASSVGIIGLLGLTGHENCP
jgi:hypothetical protein